MQLNKQYICKMIQRSILRYNHEPESIPLNEEEYDRLYMAVLRTLEEKPETDLHEIIEDIVYEYFTG